MLTHPPTHSHIKSQVTTSLPKHSRTIFNRHRMSKTIYRLDGALTAEHRTLVMTKRCSFIWRILNHALDQIFEHGKHHANCSKWKMPFSSLSVGLPFSTISFFLCMARFGFSCGVKVHTALHHKMFEVKSLRPFAQCSIVCMIWGK